MRMLLRFMVAGSLILGLMFGPGSAFGQAGKLDTTFGKGGVVVTTLTTTSESNAVIPYAVQLQTNGDILVLLDVINGASTTTDVLRYTSSGALDATFGKKGIAILSATVGEIASMALQADGQIVVAGVGSSGYTVERLNTNGSADTTFGTDGVAVANLGTRAAAPELVVLIEASGDILIAGELEEAGRGQSDQVMLARFTSSGALDTTFGSGGTTIATTLSGCSALAELSTGEILVVNSQEIAEFTAKGSLEATVTGGTIIASAGSENPSVPSVFQPNGDYLLADALFVGEESRGHNCSVQVLRFTASGAADTSFADPSFHFAGAGGFGIEAIPNAMAVQSNGDIVVVGEQLTFAQTGMTTVNGLARLTSSGALDTTFGTDGTVTNSVPSSTGGLTGVVIQPADGKIVVIGTVSNFTQLTVGRYLGD
ncbi:MAG: hypothetical protein WB630_08675 [Candidatus Acidiferrales bacterium]